MPSEDERKVELYRLTERAPVSGMTELERLRAEHPEIAAAFDRIKEKLANGD